MAQPQDPRSPIPRALGLPRDVSWGTSLPGYTYLVNKASLETQLSINFCVHVFLVLTEEIMFRACLNGPSLPHVGTLCRHSFNQWTPAQAWLHQDKKDESADRPGPLRAASTHQVPLKLGKSPVQNLTMMGLQSLKFREPQNEEA